VTRFLVQGGWLLGVALLLAVGDWWAVLRRARRVEYVLKPATLIAVLAGTALLARGTSNPWLTRWFLLGLGCSLAGDVFLMLPDARYFLPGLIAFFLAHVSYIVGLTPSLPPWPAWALLIVVSPLGLALYARVAAALQRKGETALLAPTAAYAGILSLMLCAAWATLFRPAWPAGGRVAVIVGATLFFASDAMLAWDRFVAPRRALRIAVIVTYHLAQIALSVAVALWAL
jgi:uncharacterized membrane protein YhhN